MNDQRISNRTSAPPFTRRQPLGLNQVLLAAAFAAALHGTTAAKAQGRSLASKNVTLIIGAGTGGGYDLWGRTVARHMGKHLPGNPTIVPQNMPGAGGFVAANNLYNLAPKDSTAIAIIPPGTTLGPITGATGARFDATKFTWIGTPTTETPVCTAFDSPQVKVRTFTDLYDKELVVGATGSGSNQYFWPKALNALLGMRFKPITGFPSTSNVLLAMERGEVDGICTVLDTISNQRPDWIANQKVAILFQGGGAPYPARKDVPFVRDLAKSPDDRTAIEFLFASADLGRPFMAPPGIAPERTKILQDAFMATMTDPHFLSDAKKQQLDVEPQGGTYLSALIKKFYATPRPIVDRVTELIK